jgi:hypothetical protein
MGRPPSFKEVQVVNRYREVRLEFLRHGPSHNQLLSPLTQYLALCGNHGAVTVQIPLEHAQFLARLKRLSYEGGVGAESKQARELQLKESAAVIRDVLAKVPGLIAELAESTQAAVTPNCAPGGEDCKHPDLVGSCTHLEIILSASELALLPFELADAPDGFPGAGQSLILQSQNPICMTRRARRTDAGHVSWKRQPRILFAAAQPTGKIPLEDHVTALVRCLEPWIDSSSVKEGTRKNEYSNYLTILPQASLEDIARAVERASDGADQVSEGRRKAPRPFTHVHILAHGAEYPDGVDQRFGLVLHKSKTRSEPDIVSGSRLAPALRALSPAAGCLPNCPTVVTIAACQGAQQGSVIGPGASVAHALHEAGIPLVVASQFPLTFEASTLLVQRLYDGFLRGHDPRVLVSALRRELYSRLGPTHDWASHDWASIVAYAAFPSDLDGQLQSLRIDQARKGIESAFRRYDLANTESVPQILQILDQLADSRERLYQVLDDAQPALRAEIYGLLAATKKKEAGIHAANPNPEPDAPKLTLSKGAASTSSKTEFGKRVRPLLKAAQDDYQKAFQNDPHKTWGLVQSLALTAVLDGCPPTFRADWNKARIISESDTLDDDRNDRAQAHANLIELYLLAFFQPSDAGLPAAAEAKALGHLAQLMQICGPNEWTVKSTYRQLLRYLQLFNNEKVIGHRLPDRVRSVVERLLRKFPPELQAEGTAGWGVWFEPWHWADDDGDPNSVFGHKPRSDGFELKITEVDWDGDWFQYDAVVQKNGPADWGPVRFALHPTYPRSTIIIRKIRTIQSGNRRTSEVRLEKVEANGTYTIVAQVNRPGGLTTLSYDLDRIRLPKRFK